MLSFIFAQSSNAPALYIMASAYPSDGDEVVHAPDSESSRHCTACGRPCTGHDGPYGRLRCTLAPIQGHVLASLSQSEAVEEGSITGGDDDRPVFSRAVVSPPNSVVLELIQHISKLSSKVDSIQERQSELFSRSRSQAEPNPSHGMGTGYRPPFPGSFPGHSLQYAGFNAAPPPGFPPMPTSQTPVTVPMLEGRLAARTATAANLGQYMNLNDFLPRADPLSGELETVLGDDGLTFRPKKQRRQIDDYTSWLAAWANYEAILVGHSAIRYLNCAKYRVTIHNLVAKFNWSSVAAYDMRFRAALANTNSLDFGTVDPVIYATVLDATAVKKALRACYRCKALDHVVSECPFQAEGATDVQAGRAPKTYQANPPPPSSDSRYSTYRSDRSNTRYPREPTRYHKGIEVCINYQWGRCQSPNCPRAHVCKNCRGNEPYNRCPNCYRGANNS